MEQTENASLANGVYLAFDYGSKRIGVACGNSALKTTQPLRTVANHSGTPIWLDITSLLDTWQPVALVVGEPLTADGEDQAITAHARGFMRQLRKRYPLPVYAADERYSSIIAQQELQKMRARGQRGRTDKADVDTLAAALILERWFETQTFEPL